MTTVLVLVGLLAVMLTTYDLVARIGAHEERKNRR